VGMSGAYGGLTFRLGVMTDGLGVSAGGVQISWKSKEN